MTNISFLLDWNAEKTFVVPMPSKTEATARHHQELQKTMT